MHDNDHHELTGTVRARRSAAKTPAGSDSTELDPLLQAGNRAFTRHVAGRDTTAAGRGTGGVPGVGVQRRAERSQGAGPLDPEIEADIRSAQGGGRPLDDPVRADMESHLGMDLSSVRVHTDVRGDALSRSVQADAFTTGSDVFFRSGRYSPDTSEGRELLAHELTHVVQQASGNVADESRVSHPDDPHEREASAVAETIASSPAAPTSAAAGVQRQTADEEELSDEAAAAAPVTQPTVDEGLEEEEI